MKCHLCGGTIEIQTDPQNTEYKIVSGARRVAADIREGPEINDGNSVLKREEDFSGSLNPLTALEKDIADNVERLERNKGLENLYKQNQRLWDDVYGQSQKLRKIHRTERNALRERQKEVQKLQDKYSLGVDIVETKSEDGIIAGGIDFKNVGTSIKGDSVNKIRNAVKRSLDPWNAAEEAAEEPTIDSGSEKQAESKRLSSSLVKYDSE
jgi:coiled-coil domain-containing protein 130